jgi:hypothetical protein
MLQIRGIYTIRDTPQPHYWDIVFEWEDQLSATLGVPLIAVGKKYDQVYRPDLLKKLLNRLNAYQLLDKFFSPKDFYLAFHIGPPGVYSFYSRNNVVPIIIDFWKHENIKRLESIFHLSPVVFVTSREVYNYLSEIGVKINFKLLPLSLPDKYLKTTIPTERNIDIIQIGRSNNTLNEYMNEFLKDFPDTHYVSVRKNGTDLQVVSNKSGVLGVFKERAEFINLLKQARISLVSAPGMEDDKSRTGGFSPVTPRFLESAACGCKLIGIFPANADFEHYGIMDVCVSVSNYDQFKQLANQYLADKTGPDYTAFLKKHLTSKRADELTKLLKETNE